MCMSIQRFSIIIVYKEGIYRFTSLSHEKHSGSSYDRSNEPFWSGIDLRLNANLKGKQPFPMHDSTDEDLGGLVEIHCEGFPIWSQELTAARSSEHEIVKKGWKYKRTNWKLRMIFPHFWKRENTVLAGKWKFVYENSEDVECVKEKCNKRGRSKRGSESS